MKSRRCSSRVAKTVKAAALVGVPLLLAESDLHAIMSNVILVTTPETITGYDTWVFNNGSFSWNEGFAPFLGPRLYAYPNTGGLIFTKTGGIALAVSQSASIDNTQSFGANVKFQTVATNALYGFKFTDSLSQTHYGWANITTFNGANLTINQFGFNINPDAFILAGTNIGGDAVPEPADFAAGLGALALGAAAILRRRQKEKLAAVA